MCFFFKNTEVVCCHYAAAVCLHDSKSRKKIEKRGLINTGWRRWLRLSWPGLTWMRGKIEKEGWLCVPDHVWVCRWGWRKRRRESLKSRSRSAREWEKSVTCFRPMASQPPTLPAATAALLLLTEGSTWSFPPPCPLHVLFLWFLPVWRAEAECWIQNVLGTLTCGGFRFKFVPFFLLGEDFAKMSSHSWLGFLLPCWVQVW